MTANNREKFYITTAIAYASGKPHFGNTYEVIATDAIARYKRCMNYDVFFCTGTDEHGQKIENLAKDQGITPQQYVDNVVDQIKGVWNKMNSSHDYFVRTTDDYHVKTVQKVFERFLAQGDIYKGYYEGWYCTPCESFFTDTQAVDGKCPDCGRPVTQAKEEAYFFNMNKYAQRLIDYIEENDFIQPELRKKEMVNNFLKAGLQDLCVTRSSFEWGIPILSADKHVIYVWLDALLNYITAIGYDADKTYEEQSEFFKKNWPADVHIIGKDILRFHTIYWPIFLMALDLPLPKKVFAHPWFQFGEDKMSKSKGNVIYADLLSNHFGVDGVRYYALSEMPFASDGSITNESVITRFNSDLVNNLGNLVKRTLDMQKKYFDKVIQPKGELVGTDAELYEFADKAYKEFVENMDSYHISDAVASVFSLFRRANKYIDETTPWTLAKDESQRERLGSVLYNLLEVIRRGALMLLPILPDTAKEILGQLNCTRELLAIEANDKGALVFEDFIGLEIEAGLSVNDSKVLFARVDEQKKLEELEAERIVLFGKKAEEEPRRTEKPEGIAQIGFEDFMKVELRAAKIIECEKVPKAKKLLKLIVDLGYEQRQIVSGIAAYYTPEELVGKKIVLVSNLATAKLCGIESQGMLLAASSDASDSDGKIRVVFLSDDTPMGDRIR